MNPFSPSSLMLGLVVTSPSLWQVMENPNTDITVVLLHFVVATVVAGIGLGVLRSVISAYLEGSGRRAAIIESEPIDGNQLRQG